jgi:hypothetical protein
MLVIAPADWEQATPEMLQKAVDGTGDIVNVQSLISNGQLSELANYLDESRFGAYEEIIDALLLQGNLWFKSVRM